MIRFLVSDMDGTLFAGHGETVFDLTSRNEAALKKIQQSNITFCVASGRMIEFGQKVLTKYNFTDQKMAGFNGAVCIDHGEMVIIKPLAGEVIETALKVAEKVRDEIETAQIQGLDSTRIVYDLTHPSVEKYRKDCKAWGIGRVADFTVFDYLKDDRGITAMKFIILFKDGKLCTYWREYLQKELAGKAFITSSSECLLEISHPETNKAVFVRYLKEAYHVQAEEIAVVGDGLNDSELFDEAGLCFAIAAGNEILKQRADYIVQDVAECIDICLSYNERYGTKY